MANLQTTLREISVIYGIHVLLNGEPAVLNSDSFIQILSIYLPKDQIALISQFDLNFQHEIKKAILNNGISLAKAIVEVFKLENPVKIRWTGLISQSETPIDLWINDLPFSLKEESYILENMGLYKLVNLLTGSNFDRGKLHIFKNFANDEYEDWFKITWKLLMEFTKNKPNGLIWEHKGNNYKSEMVKKTDKIIFDYKDTKNKSCVVEFNINSILTLSEFEKVTNPLIREKVFSKWVNSTISKDTYYLSAKRACAIRAGKNLVKYIKDNLKKSNVARFLRISNIEYYYAKVVNLTPRIFKVPSIKDFENVYDIEEMDYSVPDSQLNFHTIVRNKKTNNKLELRNEIRFSHGQFNGTPEAKLYYARGNNLECIYLPLYPNIIV